MVFQRSPYRQLQARAKAQGIRVNQSALALSTLLDDRDAGTSATTSTPPPRSVYRNEDGDSALSPAPTGPSTPSASAADKERIRWLLLVVMIDLSAVALVVPLIPVKMRELGVRP